MKKLILGRRQFLAAASAGAAMLAMPSILRAQSYATQPVRLFVGTAAAGSNDLVARLIAPSLEAALGQPVVIENRPGGATTLAVGIVQQARPDGHTFLVSSAAAVSTYVASVAKPANLLGDLDHIGMICDGSYIYAVHKDVPVSTTDELIRYMKENPGAIRYGATGAGGGIHLSGALFQQQTGTEMTVIQYANAGMRLNELLANQTQLGIAGAAVLAQQIEAGTLTPLFVAGAQRLELFPDVPTSIEGGIEGLEDISNWFALHAPKGLSREISEFMNHLIAEALKDQRVIEGLTAAGLFGDHSTSEALIARMHKDVAVTERIIELAGIRIE